VTWSRLDNVYVAERIGALEKLRDLRGLHVHESQEMAALVEIQQRRAADLTPEDLQVLAVAVARFTGTESEEREVEAVCEKIAAAVGVQKS
jgi:hypothetical protein